MQWRTLAWLAQVALNEQASQKCTAMAYTFWYQQTGDTEPSWAYWTCQPLLTVDHSILLQHLHLVVGLLGLGLLGLSCFSPTAHSRSHTKVNCQWRNTSTTAFCRAQYYQYYHHLTLTYSYSTLIRLASAQYRAIIHYLPFNVNGKWVNSVTGWL